MLRVSLRHLRAHSDSLLAIINTTAGSLFWLGLAFAMTPSDYGRMMALQASVLLVGLVFSFRTHDLVFYVINSLDYTVERGFRVSVWLEWISSVFGISFVILSFSIYYYFFPREISILGLFCFSILSSIGSNHGAAIAKLRYYKHQRAIVHADAACVASWAVALATVPFLTALSSSVILSIGAAPTALRALWLTAKALAAASEDSTPPHFVPPRKDLPIITRYLLNGQAVNFVKNGAVSLETVILAAFIGAREVGLYRITRGTLGVSVAALNVVYQKAFPELARAESPEEMRRIGARLDKSSLLVQLSIFPLAAAVIGIYAEVTPDVSMLEVQLILLGILASQLPVALQQSSFATLSLAGRHHTVSLGYFFTFGLLAAVAGAMAIWPRMALFLCGLTLANLARFGWLRWQARDATHRAASAVAVR